MDRREWLQRAGGIGTTLLLPQVSTATPADPTSPLFIPAGEGKRARVGQMELVFKFSKQQTAGHLGLWETIIQPGELAAPPHLHEGFDEVLRVLEGTVHVMVGETVTAVNAGGWHLRPKGMIHSFWNSGTVPARTIDLCLPGGHEAYMESLARLFENGQRPKPADFDRLEREYDIRFRFDLLPGIINTYKVHL